MDSVAICQKLKETLREHKDSFSADFFSETTINIDTIIYNSTFSKMAILVIIKNPTSRQLMPDASHNSYFAGTCYLGQKTDKLINLSWYGLNFTNSSDRSELSKQMRETYFCEISETKNDSLGRYNLDDIRFWDSSVSAQKFPFRH